MKNRESELAKCWWLRWERWQEKELSVDDFGFLWWRNFRENHCVLDASETLSISKLTMGLAGVECRTKEHFHLSTGHAGPWSSSRQGEIGWKPSSKSARRESRSKGGKSVERKRCPLQKGYPPTVFRFTRASHRGFYYTRSFRINPQPLIPKNSRRAIKMIRL